MSRAETQIAESRIEAMLAEHPVEIGRYSPGDGRPDEIYYADLITLEDSSATRRAWLASLGEADRKLARKLLRELAQERRAQAEAHLPVAYRGAIAAIDSSDESETL